MISREPFSYPCPVSIDFSNTKTVNHPQYQGENTPAALIHFKRTDITIKRYQSKSRTGSYLPQNDLKKILHKSKEDRSYYECIDSIRKSDPLRLALREDFEILKAFFPAEIVLEVKDYCLRIIPKIIEKFLADGYLKLTPRNRRTFILAVFRSICRKNGRNFTPKLIREINNRFNYKRTIKFLEVCKAEHQLIDWNFLTKIPDRKTTDLKNFYLHLINNCNRLKKDETITANETNLKIISLTQKFITGLTKNKEQKKGLANLIKHNDKDFISRLFIWVIAKYFAKKQFDLTFRKPEEVPGWSILFLVENSTHELKPIRTFGFIFWTSFDFKKRLKEVKLLPEEG